MSLRENRDGPTPGIVHLGLGAFFRAHGAIYIKEAQEHREGDWGVFGVSLRSSRVRDLLSELRCVYSAVEVAGDIFCPQKIDILSDVLVAPERPIEVIEAMAAEEIKIVSLTITEKGYCRANGGQSLNFEHLDIKNDVTNPSPKSALGFIVRALEIRRRRKLRPFTVLSLDNLPGNGRLVRRLTIELAAQIDTSLAHWIEKECRFPCSMVDRIVPATTPEMIDRLEVETGVRDHGAVFHEPFRQFVIENNFVGNERPDFGAVGVQIVDDVEPYEHMKLRMLNGSHSALAYIGQLAGYTFVDQAFGNHEIEAFLTGMWAEELAPSLVAPKDVDLDEYTSLLKERYRNPEIRHSLKQIAMDGSQKLPQRIIAPLFENLNAGRPHRRLLYVIASWFRFLQLNSENEEINDPISDELKRIVRSSHNVRHLVVNLLANKQVFGNYPVAKVVEELVIMLRMLNDGDVYSALENTRFD